MQLPVPVVVTHPSVWCAVYKDLPTVLFFSWDHSINMLQTSRIICNIILCSFEKWKSRWQCPASTWLFLTTQLRIFQTASCGLRLGGEEAKIWFIIWHGLTICIPYQCHFGRQADTYIRDCTRKNCTKSGPLWANHLRVCVCQYGGH